MGMKNFKSLIGVLALLLLMATKLFAPAITEITTVEQFTNTVNSFNALSIDGVRRNIHLGAGTFALPVGTYRMHVSNNICIKGEGWNQTKITGLGSLDNPMIWLWDNCEMSDLKIESTSVAGLPDPQLGCKASSANASSTNVVVRNVWLKGDFDGFWISTAGGLYGDGFGNNTVEWKVFNCFLENNFDVAYVESSNNGDILIDGIANDGPCVLRIYDTQMLAHGPAAGNVHGGAVTVTRAISGCARLELYNCSITAGGGTNVVSGNWNGSVNATDASLLVPQSYLLPGGVYFNNVSLTLYATNQSAGALGACISVNTNGLCVFNGVTTKVFTATNTVGTNVCAIIGTGTNVWINPRSLGGATATVGTAADTLEKDLLTQNILPGTLGDVGQAVELLAWGTYGATANTKALRVKLGAATGSGSLTLLDTAGRAINGGDWFLRGQIARVNQTTMKASLLFEAPGFTTNEYTSVTLSCTTNNTLRLTGSNHTAQVNDLVLEGYKVTHLP